MEGKKAPLKSGRICLAILVRLIKEGTRVRGETAYETPDETL